MVLSSKMDNDGVSSINSGAVLRARVRVIRFSHSGWVSWPLLIFSPSSEHTLLMRRLTSCRLDISKENTATG